jgi:hypothetical protein
MPASDSHRRFRTAMILVAAGGWLMTASMFFRLVYGPMGGSIRYFEILSSNILHGVSPTLVLLWPIAFGLLEAVAASLSLVAGERVRRLHWFVLAIFLAAVSLIQAGLTWWYRGIAFFGRSESLKWWIPAVAVGVILLVVAAVVRGSDRRSAVLRLAGATWVLLGLYPVSEWTPLETVYWAYGPGYWLLLAGTLLLVVGSVRQWTAAGR